MLDTIMFMVVWWMVISVLVLIVNQFLRGLVRSQEEKQYWEWVRRQRLDYPYDHAPMRKYRPNTHGMPLPMGISSLRRPMKYTPPV